MRRILVVSVISVGLLLLPVLASAKDAPKAKKGSAFVLKSADGNSKLKLSGRVQARYTYEGKEGMGKGADDSSHFGIQRARLGLSGHAFTKKLRYKYQHDMGKGKVSLKDFWADYELVNNWLHIRAGQWKRPFSRQQINSSGKLELIDRAITDKKFLAGRDIGVAFHNNYEKSPEFEYVLGVFNGTGTSSIPTRFTPTLALRLGYNYGGIKGYSESDMKGGGLRFGIGASALMNMDLDDDDSSDSAMMAELDFILKIAGFSTSGAVYYAKTDGETATASTDQTRMLSGKAIRDGLGFHAQAGYMIAKKYQPVIRYSMVMYDEGKTMVVTGQDNSGADVIGEVDREKATYSELAVGFAWYFYKHKFKWQTEFAMTGEKAGDDEKDGDMIVRSQLQLAF